MGGDRCERSTRISLPAAQDGRQIQHAIERNKSRTWALPIRRRIASDSAKEIELRLKMSPGAVRSPTQFQQSAVLAETARGAKRMASRSQR